MSDEIIALGEGNDRSPFERIKRTSDTGSESWSSRDFAKILEYTNYRNFEQVIAKAKVACFNSGQRLEDHFVDIDELIQLPKNAVRSIKTTMMSRYACYLVIQNADPTKQIVALGQTYFAIQTRKQELSEQQIEEGRRLLLRNELKRHNTQLAEAAKECGVIEPVDYAIFQNHGYQGLYDGMSAKDIHRHKGLKPSQQILDHMGSTELAANLFRATQAEEKLKRDKVRGKQQANRTHFDVGKKVRQTIQELGGTMPEDLPAANSIKKLESKSGKNQKQLGSDE